MYKRERGGGRRGSNVVFTTHSLVLKAAALGLQVDIQVFKFNTITDSICMYHFPRTLPSENSASQISIPREPDAEMMEARQDTLNIAHYSYQYDGTTGHYNSVGKRPAAGGGGGAEGQPPEDGWPAAPCNNSLRLVSLPEDDCFIATMLTAAGVLHFVNYLFDFRQAPCLPLFSPFPEPAWPQGGALTLCACAQTHARHTVVRLATTLPSPACLPV